MVEALGTDLSICLSTELFFFAVDQVYGFAQGK